MTHSEWFSISVLIVSGFALILAGVLSFLPGDPFILAVFGLLPAFGICVGVGVGYCISCKIKVTVGGNLSKNEEQISL